MRCVPIVFGVTVIVYLFGWHLDWTDQVLLAEVISVVEETRSVSVEIPGDKRVRVDVAWQDVVGGKATQAPDASPGDQLSFYKRGVGHYAQGLGVLTIAGVFGLLILAILVQTYRLKVLFDSAGSRVRFVDALKGFLLGLFYGNVIPAGQIGGDPLKALYIAKRSNNRRTMALAATGADRVIGLCCLLALAITGLLISGWETTLGDQSVVVGLFTICFFGATAIGMSARLQRLFRVHQILERIPMGSKISSMLETVTTIASRPGVLFLAIVLSLSSQVLLVLIVFIIGRDIGVIQVTFWDYLGLTPLANTVASLPGAPPGGWGVGEGAYLLLFGTLGVPAAQAFTLSVVPRLAFIFVSLTGLITVFDRETRHLKGELDEVEAADQP